MFMRQERVRSSCLSPALIRLAVPGLTSLGDAEAAFGKHGGEVAEQIPHPLEQARAFRMRQEIRNDAGKPGRFHLSEQKDSADPLLTPAAPAPRIEFRSR